MLNLKRCGLLRWLKLYDLKRARQRERDATRDYELSIATLLGLLTLNFAAAERGIDEIIAWYQARVGTVIRKDHPRSLSRKLDYLKRMEPDVRFYGADSATIRKIRIEAKRLSEIRHDVAHGIANRKHSRVFVWTIERVIYPNDIPTIREKDYSNDDIKLGLSDITALNALVQEFNWRLVQIS